MLFDQTFINIITLLGLNFITGLTGQMNLGTAGIFAIGAYTSSLLCVKLGISPWLGLIAAIVMGYLIGIGLGWPSLRIKGIYLALTTLGFGEIIRLLIANMSKFTGGTQGVKGIPFYNLFGLTIGNEREFYYFLLIVTIIMVYFSSRIVNSKWGRAFKAIRDNELAVETCGINISDIKIKAFTLASIYGCIGGALFAHLMGYINPVDFNIDLSVKYLMMLMVGGIGSVPGSIIGAIVVTLLPEYLRFLQNYYWLTFSVILLIFSVLLPNGLISLFDVVVKSVKMKGGGNNANYSSSK
ncbi:branched-chain amino acid ABC transporter permease [Thermoanaerobacteraceae bacterium SP2]|nr:branched-chain amino acid ABC transporter permease [Thermoanaerobacteraceae bacterium SP2]